MATSRTGTARYLRNRKRVLAKAQADGITRCPGYTDTQGVHHSCGVELDYETPKLPNSAEADHILAPKFGGTDDIENLQVLCRAQNIAKGDGSKVIAGFLPASDFPMSRAW